MPSISIPKAILATILVCAVQFTVSFADDVPKATPNPSPAIVKEVDTYLQQAAPKLKQGTEPYFATIALEEALKAFKEGNYGIGSIVILKWKDQAYEFRGRNAMVTGYGLRDHAEARALDRAIVFLTGLRGKKVTTSSQDLPVDSIKPDRTYLADTEYLKALADGLHVYGTLEPCPMCMVMMLNVGVKSSKSLAKDGELKLINGRCISDGAALATDDKITGAPVIWQFIRERQGLHFKLYDQDKRLSDLGLRIFLETRKQIDDLLAGQG